MHHDPSGTEGCAPAVELFEQLLHAVGDVVLVTTAEPFAAPGPVILYANAALLSQTGYSYRDVLGRSPRIFQGPETNAIVRLACATP